MPRIGDRVRVRADGRTATIRGVREEDSGDQYGIVYDEVGDAPGAPAPGQDPTVWVSSDELEVIT